DNRSVPRTIGHADAGGVRNAEVATITTMKDPLRIVVASSGLGHVARGIEAWANDLACALAERGHAVTLCKGGGTAERPFERVIPCWHRGAARTTLLIRMMPSRGTWRLGLASPYDVEQWTFALRLIPLLRQQKADILHVQDPFIALMVRRARKLRMVP